MAKTAARSKECIGSRNSNRQQREMTSTRHNALQVYIPYEAWLKSVLEGRHGRVDVEVVTIDYGIKEQEEEELDLANYVFEDDILYLRSLDPKEWKGQDHYAVLGIKELRHRATEDVIKRAYKHKILKHHPDKRKAMGEEIRVDDDYFTCITRAWETLGNPKNRRSYDSVDPCFSDALPDEREAKDNFYVVMGKAFRDNSRWSVKQPVPKLGGPNASRDKVEKFYMFWYDFESWREYSYEDEEDKESGQDRETRRWIEKKNKATRAKRKKEEVTRIRSLVDLAYNLDPRMRAFQQADKDRKQAVKRAKQEAARARQYEEERVAREAAERERAEKAAREAAEKARADAAKQEREQQKKALRRERKNFRDVCKEGGYFAASADEQIRHMESVEKICELFKAAQLEATVREVRAEGKVAFVRVMGQVERKIEAERRAAFGGGDAKDSCKDKDKDKDKDKEKDKDKDKREETRGGPKGARDWGESELQLLIKAVNLFPAGTVQRWEVVANFVNQHNNAAHDSAALRDAKQVLAKAKDLQSTDFSKSSMKEQANRKAFDNFVAEKKHHKDVEERMPAASERLDGVVVQNGKPAPPAPPVVVVVDDAAVQQNDEEAKEKKDATPTPWTLAEQKLLEQALKTYPASVSDRWDQISACVPTRSKKECMKRYKELVELIKAKKAAQTPK